MSGEQEYIFIIPNVRVPRGWLENSGNIMPIIMAAIEAQRQYVSSGIYVNINEVMTKLIKIHNVVWFKKMTPAEIMNLECEIQIPFQQQQP